MNVIAASATSLVTLLNAYVAEFNAADEELYTNAIPNYAAAEFLAQNIPLFECPDNTITRAYYFRWWTYRKHLRKTPSGWVVTEFLPDVGWAGKNNTISCPFGHHLREGRWLRNTAFLDDYIHFMLTEGTVNGPRAYASWPAWGTLERAKVTGDLGYAKKLLQKFVGNSEAWEKGWATSGMSLRDVENRQGAKAKTIKTGFRADRGLFDFPGNREGSEFALSHDGARPMVNAAMWAEATAIAEIARRSGDAGVAERFAAKAAALEKNIKAKLWNGDKRFFTALSVEGEHDDVCELHGYAPFYFRMPLAGYEAAWEPLVEETGFAAPAGLSFPARNTPGVDLRIDLAKHECLWNGPSWPYATSIALTALYESLQGAVAVAMPIGASDFVKLLHQYAAQQKRILPDGREVPWIDENLDPVTGEWIARKVMIDWDRKGMRPLKYRERGKDYNHSTFCDLVIAGLVGVRPKPDGMFEVKPMAPDSWDWFRLEHLHYHGKSYTIIFDRTGRYYGGGAGLRVVEERTGNT